MVNFTNPLCSSSATNEFEAKGQGERMLRSPANSGKPLFLLSAKMQGSFLMVAKKLALLKTVF